MLYSAFQDTQSTSICSTVGSVSRGALLSTYRGCKSLGYPLQMPSAYQSTQFEADRAFR